MNTGLVVVLLHKTSWVQFENLIFVEARVPLLKAGETVTASLASPLIYQ